MKKWLHIACLLILIGFSATPALKAAQFFFLENDLVGKPVPNFTLKTTKGTEFNLSDYRENKRTILFFWATWCPHCRETLGDLSGRKDEIEQKNVKLAMIDLGESKNIVEKYMEKHKVPFDVVLDTEESLADPYNIVGVPTFVFIDEKGIVKDVSHSFPKDFQKVFKSS